MEQFAPGERVAWRRSGVGDYLGVVVRAWVTPRGEVVGWLRLDRWPALLARVSTQAPEGCVLAFAHDCDAEVWK